MSDRVLDRAIDLLAVSPHLDDAAFSCGGQIHRMARTGARVMVLTLFAGEPEAGEPEAGNPVGGDLEVEAGVGGAAAEFHRLLGLTPDEAKRLAATRRDEDLVACERLAAEAVHWPFADAVDRRHPAHRHDAEGPLPTLRALFDRSRPLDDALVEQLATRLRALPTPRRVLVPLGIGGHLDHRTARAAAERAFAPSTLRYVEDFPYSRSFRARWRVLGLATLADSLDRSFGRWRFEPSPLAPEDLDVKISASAAYTSQIPPLFGDLLGLETQMERAAQTAARGLLEAHAEPTWRRAGSMGAS